MNLVDWRTFFKFSALLAAEPYLPALAQDSITREEHPRKTRSRLSNAPKVAMLIYPRMVALDLIGPMTTFNIARLDIHLVWKNKTFVANDLNIHSHSLPHFRGVSRQPRRTVCPRRDTMGTTTCINDPKLGAFLADRGEQAKWVISVCTGALVLRCVCSRATPCLPVIMFKASLSSAGT